jgi:hypothetical protein
MMLGLVSLFECRYAVCHYTVCRYAECHYAECCNAECHYAECCYTERHYAESRGAKSKIGFRISIFSLKKISKNDLCRNLRFHENDNNNVSAEQQQVEAN